MSLMLSYLKEQEPILRSMMGHVMLSSHTRDWKVQDAIQEAWLAVKQRIEEEENGPSNQTSR